MLGRPTVLGRTSLSTDYHSASEHQITTTWEGRPNFPWRSQPWHRASC